MLRPFLRLASFTVAFAIPSAARAQATVRLLDYAATVPPGWVTAPATSSMRLAQYTIPGRNGALAAEVVVYFFGTGQGGNVDANLQRWRAQFSMPDGSAPFEQVARDSSGAFPVTIAEYRGTYARGIGAGDAANAKPGQSLIAVIAETPRGTLFFQLFGATAGVTPQRAALVAFVKSMKAGHSADTAQAEPLPAASEVVARYDKALGGVAAMHRHKSLITHATVEVRKPDGTVRIPITVWMREPYYQLTVGVMPGNAGIDSSGFDGENAWHIAPDGKAEIFTGDNRESIKRDADFYYPITELSWFKTMETVGIEDFEGHSCYHLHGVTNWGVSNNQFYDRTTGLLVGYEFDNTWRGAPALDHEVFSDYRKVDGVLIPMIQTSKAKPKSGTGDWTVAQVVTHESVAFNNVEAPMFAPPNAVRALLEKDKPE